MATPKEGAPAGGGRGPDGAGGGGPGAGGEPRPIHHHQYAQLNIKQPMFNWDGNQYESYKMFKNKASILLNGPYVYADGPSKVAAILSWLGDKGFQLYANTDWDRLGKDKTNWQHVLEAFSEHFRPCQTVMQAWYQLGNPYSQQCANQTDFMTRLKELAAEGGFSNPEEIVKFLFLIHNTNQKVREYLIDKAEPTKTVHEFLTMARTVESQTATETLSKKLLANVGGTSIGAVGKQKFQRPGTPGKKKPGYRQPSASPGRKCGKCGFSHKPNQCPAYGKTCKTCKGKNHFWKVCKTKNPNKLQKGGPRTSRKDQHEVGQEYQTGYQSELEIHEDSVHIEFSRYTFGKLNGPKTNIMFDEVTNSQALGDLRLKNRAGIANTERFKLDSGAGANLLPIGMYSKLFSKKDRDLDGSIDPRVKLYAANNSIIKQLGSVRLRVQVGQVDKVCHFYVVPNYIKPIFGLPDLLKMEIVKFSVPITNDWTQVTSIDETSILPGLTKGDVLERYHDVFSGLGKLKVDPVKIHLKKGAEPVRRPCRRVPIALRPKFKEELDNSVEKGILTKLNKNQVTEWLNSFVNVNKANGKLRVCLDPTGLNPYILRPVFNSYTLDEISFKLRGAKVFTVCDANKGFFQVPLHEDSKHLTAMLTPEGVYVHNVLAMGLSLSSDVFEMIMRDILKGLPGVINIADDLLIFGRDVQEHDRNLLGVLNKARSVGLTLNPDKLKFKCNSVPFFGNLVTSEGIKPDPKKIESIANWPSPTNLKELQSFLGAVNYLSKFIPTLSSLRNPLSGLCKKNSEYMWTGTHEKAFQTIKQAVCDTTMLCYYDKDLPIFIEVDASGQGLGAVLLQGDVTQEELNNSSQVDGKYLKFRDKLKPIAFASKSLSEAENRYSNIERELLGWYGLYSTLTITPLPTVLTSLVTINHCNLCSVARLLLHVAQEQLGFCLR